MDTRTSYREIIKAVISKYARLRPSHGTIRLDTLFDEQQSLSSVVDTILENANA